MAALGADLALGRGCEQNVALGSHRMSCAATLGSRLGAYNLGFFFCNGTAGFPKDAALAAEWLQMALKPPIAATADSLDPPTRAKAGIWLVKHWQSAEALSPSD